jgi:pimeloyl-ACP methyl ester carboxylesterase
VKRFLQVGTALVGLVALVWTYGAMQAGHFIRDRSVRVGTTSDGAVEAFSRRKKLMDLGPWQVAYIDEGAGPPVVLLHGCPFHSYEWRDVIPRLTPQYRVIAPDLLGLGDTVVRLDDDYRLPNDVQMVVGLLDALHIDTARFVGHDHGGATLQLLMKQSPGRIHSAVLTNVEAYDLWPSEPERPYLEWIVNPVTSPVFRLALGFTPVQREVFSIAVHRPTVLTDEDLAAYVRPHTSSPGRWLRLRRFFRWQLDREHNRETLRALDGMRRFDRPTLLLWGKQDTNFGPALANRLATDIPGVVRIEWLEHSAHMPMQEEPEAYARALLRFFSEDGVPGSDGQPVGERSER